MKFILTAAVVGILAVTMATAEVRQTFPTPARGGEDPVDRQQRIGQMQNWLVSEMPSGAMDRPLRVSVSADDLLAMEAPTSGPAPVTVGVTKTMDHSFRFAGAGSEAGGHFSNGAFRRTDDGGFVWAITVGSEGAAAMRINLSDFRMPANADLYVYNLEGMAAGPYRNRGPHGDGEFWTDTLLGSELIVQVRFHGRPSGQELAHMGFDVIGVGHITSKFTPAASQEAFCSYNVSCIVGAECPANNWGPSNTVEDGVALMLWVSGAFINTCTGTLLNDSASSGTPWFLTANHCINKGKDAKNLETYWGYSTGCSGPCPSAWTGGGTMLGGGANIASTSTNSDHSLLELKQSPPSGAVALGWNNGAVSGSDGTPLYRISHPATAPQAFSHQTVDTGAGTCSTLPRGEFIYSQDVIGATEGGSSGSAICNASGQVVGQLFGACGTNPNDSCDSANNSTVDGALAHYFSSVESFLDPGGSCTPSPENCTNGSDDDCDNLVDCNDPDCDSDPACQGGTCGAKNDQCSSGADCCSGNCKPNGRCR